MKHLFRLPLLVEEDAGIRRLNEPVIFGIPFPKGAVWDPSTLVLFDDKGQRVCLQVQVSAHWPDASIKWGLLDFQANVEGGESSEYQMCGLERPLSMPEPPGMAVDRLPDSVVVNTGRAIFVVNAHSFKPFERVVVQGSDIIEGQQSKTVLVDERGEEYEPVITNISIETKGPLRITLCASGKLLASKGTPLADFVGRLSFYRGTSLVELKLTLRNPRAARHPGGLWDLGDQGSIYFKGLSNVTAMASAGPMFIEWATQPGEPPVPTACSALEIYQDSSGGQNWRSTNHVNRFGEVKHTFPGYRLRVDGNLAEAGKRATPLVSFGDDVRVIQATIEGFWQNFPKAIEVQDKRLRIGLFPSQYDDVYELQGGEQKTHTIFLHFGLRCLPSDSINWVHTRLVPRALPDWYANSKVIHYLAPRVEKSGQEECLDLVDCLVDSAVKGDNTFADRREVIDEYGWRHFGDLYADHEAVGHKGPTPLVSHYNNQYDVIYGAIIQYFRSGDLRWYRLMRDLARHVIDIDIYHTQEDRQAFNGGMFWHTEHYTDAATATHRTYSKANLGGKGRYLSGGGPACEHNYTSGLLHYYFLTGDATAGEAVQGLANWVINMDDGSERLLSMFDGRPTGLCSATAGRDYHGPGRGCGNSINALIDAYILTREQKFLSKAEELILRCIHPGDDIPSKNLEDVEHKWSYLVFLQILGKYLDFKVDENQIDYMYSYSKESLLHYARWMLTNEVPYKLVLDKVEIPTETWPAQDIRKSNVLKFAAKYSSEPIRTTFLEKSDLFFKACITDLLSFETYSLTRPIVLLMTNTFVHAYFHMYRDTENVPPGDDYEFGYPHEFLPQFHKLYRARDQLRRLVSNIQRGYDIFLVNLRSNRH